ncbi:uncharacterized protein LOC142606583 [Castanea sativa]|uniref:uncharacterized protein LOC142606583 n=1 Tax=Castanea sativa TaxID=21020 RepID=UPI003F65175B
MRRFNPKWSKEYESWLEYNIEKDAAYCLNCYLFRQDVGMQSGGDSFVTKGFNSWNKKEKLDQHIGGVNSAHNQALQDAFRGHDESDDSSDKGNFLELLQFLANHNDVINDVLQKTPKNSKVTHPDIQKDIVNAVAYKTTNAIIEDLGSKFFSILVDESYDISIKEQMVVVLRYVDKKGIVTERFLGIAHVADTSALSLKAAIEFLFCKYSLSLSRLRGQGYDEVSNMQGEFNGLKTLILKENKSTFYVHYFAHQLQLTLVAIANKHIDIAEFFSLMMRDDEWEALLTEVSTFCSKHDIPILNMEEIFVVGVRPRRNTPQITNLHHYCVDLFFKVIDLQLQEFNNLFSEVTIELLLCMACLNPSDSFSAFDIQKLTHLAKFYPSDFSETDVLVLDNQLQTYIVDMLSNNEFLELKGIEDLARKMVETNKDAIYPLVYLLVKLVLTLLKEIFQQ